MTTHPFERSSNNLAGPVSDPELILIACRWKDVAQESKSEHLGLGGLLAYLRAGGARAAIIDANFFPIPPEKIAQKALQTNCLLAGFSLMRSNIDETFKTIHYIRQKREDLHITCGGHEATHSYEQILKENPDIDSIVIGEGEEVLFNLYQAIKNKRNWQNLSGIACRDRTGMVIQKKAHPLIKDLNRLPFPDRQMYGDYLSQCRTATIYSSRGCHGRCCFCGIRLFYARETGSPWRARSPKKVVDEIAMLVQKYGVTTIKFNDDNFMGPGRSGRDRARRIGEELLARGIKVGYSCMMRADNADADLIRFLSTTGLYRSDIGIESWLQRQLDLYGKLTTEQQNHQAVAALKDAGIQFSIYMIPYDPYVTVSELRQNYRISASVGFEHFPPGVLFNRLRLDPRSPLYHQLLDDGLIEKSNGKQPGESLPYKFYHPESEVAFQLGRQLLKMHTSAFQPLFENCSIPLNAGKDRDDFFSKRIFLQDVEIAFRKLMIARFQSVLQRLEEGKIRDCHTLSEELKNELGPRLQAAGNVLYELQLPGNEKAEIRVNKQIMKYRKRTG